MSETSPVFSIKRLLGRILALLLPIALAVGVVLWSGALKHVPEPGERGGQVRPMRVLTLAPIPFTPQVSGYGSVEPAREWRAIARIEGEVVEMSDRLENGQFVSKGDLLLRIDDTDIRLGLAQVDARLASLDVRESTLRANEEIAEKEYALAAADLARKTELLAQGTVSQTVVEQAERAELVAKSKRVEIANQLALNAAERQVLRTERQSAARSLSFAEIRAPFDVLIGEVSVSLGQVVNRAQTLFTADGTDRVEIPAQVPIGRMGPLVRMLEGEDPLSTLKATVRMSMAGHHVQWPAVISRISEGIDMPTQSVVVIATVEGPLAMAIPGRRPPLRRGMFVELVIAAPETAAIVVPASAVWGAEALVVNGDNRIERRSVTVSFETDGLAVISEGLAKGDRLVVGDPAVAVVGMQVRPIEDKALAQTIARRAAGFSEQ